MSSPTKIKKTACLILSVIFISGCATYKFHHGKAPYNKGYVVSRDDYAIPEYTLGKDNTVPPLKIARERFKRRKRVVEDYYKRMGLIQNHFMMAVYDPAITFVKLVGGVFRLPAIAIKDYKYEHNPKYREKVKKIEAEQDEREARRIASLKEKLNEYIIKDLAKEKEPPAPVTREAAPPQPEIELPAVKTEEPAPEKEPAPAPAAAEKPVIEQKPIEPPPEPVPAPKEEPVPAAAEKPVSLPPVVEKTAEEPVPEPKTIKTEETLSKPKPLPRKITTPAPKKEKKPVIKEKAKKPVKKVRPSPKGEVNAAISAIPLKGYSPLKVRFDGRKSTSPYGKIVSYEWDFGDGDTSTAPNPANTYWSATFGSRYFTAILTVRDDKGNTAESSVEIEVATK